MEEIKDAVIDKLEACEKWIDRHGDDIDYLKADAINVTAFVMLTSDMEAGNGEQMGGVITLMCYAFYLGRTGKILQEER